jgi:hypothetical protein
MRNPKNALHAPSMIKEMTLGEIVRRSGEKKNVEYNESK